MLRPIVSAIRTPFFQLKEYLHRRPQPGFDWTFGNAGSDPHVLEAARVLNNQGIVVLPGYFSGDLLQRMQQCFDRALRERAVRIAVRDSINVTELLDFDPCFVRAAFDDGVLEIMARYFQKPFGFGRLAATRLLRTEAHRDTSYQWHHDARGRQLHLMVLLTDVPADGQRMQYLTGSQQRYYSKARGQGHGSRFEADIRRGERLGNDIVDVTGVAGTVAIFDSNGLHSGTRVPAPERDTVIYSYVSWRHCWQWKPKVRRSDFEVLTAEQKRVLAFNPHYQLIAN
ncbi:MAG: phytanoyl-CoA dioxygenase family protein [Pseudomonadota bacterium]